MTAKPLPRINPRSIEFDAKEIGFTLKADDTLLRELERNREARKRALEWHRRGATRIVLR